MSTSLTDQALKFVVERGWPMVPSTGPEKKPCVAWKRFQQQLPTVDELRQWNRSFRPERWGLVTGKLAGVVVVDLDGELGRNLMEKWGIKPHVRTGSGGFHWYLLHPGWHVPTLNAKSGKLSWPWPGLDIRGDGGFAVLLGRNSNGPYEELRELVPEPFDTLPGEVVTFLRNYGTGDATQKRVVPARQLVGASGKRVDPERLIQRALAKAPQNGRNNWGFWLACQLRDNGYSIGNAEAAMREYRSRVASTNTKGKPEPYTEPEMMASLREAYSQPARSPWARRNPLPHDGLCLVTAPSAEPNQRDRGDSISSKQSPDHQNADDPESLCLHVVHTGVPLVVHTGEPLSQSRFARIPIEVSTDRRLSKRDICVYGVLALSCWPGTVSEVGKRRIASQAGCAERLVIESLKHLASAGHIQKQPRKHGQRGRYVLLSPVFAQKQRPEAEGVSARPLAMPRKDAHTAFTSASRSHPVIETSSPRRSAE